MHSGSEQEQQTHKESVVGARQSLLEELGIASTELGQTFLRAPINHRVRVSGVRASFARFAGDALETGESGLQFGSYLETSDQVLVQRATVVPLREQLTASARATLTVPFTLFAQQIAVHGGKVFAKSLPEISGDVIELGQKLHDSPPTYAGWEQLQAEEVNRAFEFDPPLISDRKEFYRRLKLACTYALDRSLLDKLARQNPGFLDYLQCFPVARSIKRKVIAFLGPTNSGKTHRAVIELSRARNGMYLGPLRLLALEQRDRLNDLGCACSLVTGEERDEQSPTHSARTVEMTDFSRRFEISILDEMQLAFDRARGWAWIAAYCGVAADTLIVTGPISTEPVIRRLAALCGDTVEIHTLPRQGTLTYEGVLDWRHVPPRSAVIGFSRAMVLELKAMFESRGLRVSILYGGLSPEVRRNEARRFREGESDIVCATDAIGLGLNLPLDRVIFYETDKFDGEVQRALSRAEILQIGGRAGRGPGSSGMVAAFSARDGRRVQAALAHPQSVPEPEHLPAAPTAMHVRAIADHLGHGQLQVILDFFRTRLTFPGGTFFPEVRDDVFAAAELVDSYAPNLPVEKRYALACTPVDLEEHAFRNVFAEWLETLAAHRPVKFPRHFEGSDGLDGLEEMLQLTTVYRWLSLKFPSAFTDLPWVEQLRKTGIEQTQAILRQNWSKHGLRRRECTHCQRALLPSSPHRVCRECHREGFD